MVKRLRRRRFRAGGRGSGMHGEEIEMVARVTAVEITVAATSGASERGRIGGCCGGGRHKLAAAVERVTTEVGRVIFQTLFVTDTHFSGDG